MKFLSSLSVALSIGAVSASIMARDSPGVAVNMRLARRDLQTIQTVVNDVNSKVNALDSAVNAFSGDQAPVLAANTDLLNTIRSGTQTVSGTSPITESDGLQLASTVQQLNSSVAKAVDDLIAKQSALVSAGTAPTVLQALNDQKTAAGDLANAITSKVPTSLQGLAAQLSGGITDSLQRGINAFQGAGSAPGSSSGAPPASSAPPAGSSPPVASPTPTGGGGLPGSSLPPTTPTVGVPTPSSVPSGSSGSSGTTGGDTGTSVGSAPSSTPVPFTGGAATRQIGASAIAFVVGSIVLLM